jgi:hypothetical protein
MTQSKDIIPGHKLVRTSIPSDRSSAIGGVVKTTSHALNRSEAKGPGSGSMGVGRPRPVSRSPGKD